MPQQLTTAVENNFTKGLITESTGLNFPEDAATDTDNCTYTLIGDTTRRLGIDFEENFATASIVPTGMNNYVWNNAGGDGQTQLTVECAGGALTFYISSSATAATPISQHKVPASVTVSNFVATGAIFDSSKECQFADGNGYLFVFHPNCDPFFVSYINGNITAALITIQIRDFVGAFEPGLAVNSRPTGTLSSQHLYNLTNQGWTQGSPWQAINPGSGPAIALGSLIFTVQSGLTGVTGGQTVNITTVTDTTPGGFFVPAGTAVMGGTVTSYSGNTMVVNVTTQYSAISGSTCGPYAITPTNQGYINTWLAAVGNYPSNSDVWWYFKDSSNAFNPTTTINQVTLNAGHAPQGHFILPAFNLNRSLASGIPSLDFVSTNVRPRTGTWFQGRVWYAGTDASQGPQTTMDYYTWTENIYFSQVVQTAADFGTCYQVNDPTSEQLFDLLPTDGGVIKIQGAGAIYKLFPIQNGMLVFATNGIWFITGSQGIGFAANDYTITKISSVRSISSTSFVDVQGLPYFWNEEGIYSVQPQQGGGLQVEPITVGTIQTFYDSIPLTSKQYVRGAYHPIDYTIQWIYRSTSDGNNPFTRYQFDKIMNYNTYNKAFFPYTVNNAQTAICGIFYASSPMPTAGDAVFKYPAIIPGDTTSTFTFADEHDTSYIDWASTATPSNYTSFFITGYKLRGQAIKRFQPQYVQMYSRQNGEASAYKIQGIWDYANDPNSGRWTNIQVANNGLTRYDTIYRRHKIRGHGYALQIKVMSVDGMPFDIQGWAIVDTVNTGT